MVHNVIIIGSGPAGYTAALYNARASLAPVVFAGFQPGGQLMITTDVENYPGFPGGVLGPEMMDLFRKQAERFGANVYEQNVERVDFGGKPLKVWTDDGQEHHAKTVIIATGASAKWIGLPGEQKYGGFGVSACATCDGFFFRNKVVAVVGGGDTAMEEAHYLTRHASKVYLIHRRGEFRASKVMQERVLHDPKIEVVWDTAVVDIHGEEEPHKVTGLELLNLKTDTRSQLPVDGLFVAIGHKPNSDLFKDVLDMDDVGYLLTEPGTTKTKVPGVFAAGDVADPIYRQAVTAAGSGCAAAIDAERYLGVAYDSY